MATSNPAAIEAMGRLSPSEMARTNASEARVLEQLQSEHQQAKALADYRRHALADMLMNDSPKCWELVEDYADAKARLILARRALDTCGFEL